MNGKMDRERTQDMLASVLVESAMLAVELKLSASKLATLAYDAYFMHRYTGYARLLDELKGAMGK